MPHDEFRKAITSLDVTKLQPNFVSQVRPDRSLPSARFSLAFPLFLALARGCASSGPTCTTHIQEGKHAPAAAAAVGPGGGLATVVHGPEGGPRGMLRIVRCLLYNVWCWVARVCCTACCSVFSVERAC
eukprot:2795426-Rhodomonas_salina.2